MIEAYPSFGGYKLWGLRLFSFGGYGFALRALALAVFGAIEGIPTLSSDALQC